MTAGPFLITGLPRSRTAWMALAATSGTVICHHEPAQHLDRWSDVFTHVWRGDVPIGISDSLLGFYLPEIIERASPRILVIERPIGHVEASLRGIGINAGPYCDALARALAYSHPLIRRVAYDDLRSTASVMDCLEHLVPRAWHDRRRIEHLQGFNVQAHIGATMESAHRAAGRIANFVPADVLQRMRAA